MEHMRDGDIRQRLMECEEVIGGLKDYRDALEKGIQERDDYISELQSQQNSRPMK